MDDQLKKYVGHSDRISNIYFILHANSVVTGNTNTCILYPLSVHVVFKKMQEKCDIYIYRLN